MHALYCSFSHSFIRIPSFAHLLNCQLFTRVSTICSIPKFKIIGSLSDHSVTLRCVLDLHVLPRPHFCRRLFFSLNHPRTTLPIHSVNRSPHHPFFKFAQSPFHCPLASSLRMRVWYAMEPSKPTGLCLYSPLELPKHVPACLRPRLKRPLW